MVSLNALLSKSELGLQLLVGDRGIDADIRWAHVSELDDPTPWLQGGEFLLTTGLSADWSDDGAAHYCERLVARGVPALGISVGPGLHYPEVPESLIAAARRTDLRLVLIDTRTPLQTVVRAVADSISDTTTQPLQTLLATQQQLMHEAGSGSGLTGLVRRLRMLTGIDAFVYDEYLRPTDEQGTDRLAPDLLRQIRRQLMRDTRGTISVQDADRACLIWPVVVDGNHRGFLVAEKEGSFTAQERSLLKSAVPIIGLLLELRATEIAPLTRAREALAERLLAGKENLEQLSPLLRLSRVEAESVQVIRAAFSSAAQRHAFMAGLNTFGRDVLTALEQDQCTIFICDPSDDVFEQLERLVAELDLAEIGIGEAVPLDRYATSVTEAVRAQVAAVIARARVMRAPRKGHQVRGVLIDDPRQLLDFSDGILGPIDAHDASHANHELLPSLRAYFDSIASIEAASAALGVHRHTMRARLKKAAELSGYDFSVPNEYLELWLAVTIRGWHHPLRERPVRHGVKDSEQDN